ncbi:threonine--tRNA ligase [Patescibacteria group bacterium]
MKKQKVIEEINNDSLLALRHSAEHVLHQAMVELFPGLKRAMGPATSEGFYHDFDYKEKISEEDFPKIEKRMAEIVESDLPIIRKKIPISEARELFKDNPYKQEWLDEIEERGEKATVYWTGEPGKSGSDVDLCKGPHVKSTGKVKTFKLLSIAGAYWHGDEKNKMLTRIYGTAFNSKKDLDEYLEMIEEAKKRDHRKLGPQLELFFLHESAPGMPYWLPKGTIIINELMKFWREEHKERGYQETITPLINKKELWEISGHWEHYKDGMFIADMGEDEIYGIKPMNCPNAMMIYKMRPRSYRELPLRLSDADTLHRYEQSGELHGLLRVQEFRQDDAHIFVTENQIEDEYERILDITDLFYEVVGLKYKIRLGTRPEKFLGDPKVWDRAEETLKKILEKRTGKENYILGEGEGAFYGPKLDIMVKDSLGREWQTGTIQLDFQLPQRFDLKYIANDGSQQMPIVIHRVIYGSIERFMGILIEHFAGAFPVWLSPVQAILIPIGEKHGDYAQKVSEELKKAGIRVEIDSRSDTMQAKIRDSQIKKVPYMLVVGDREVKKNEVSVRLRTEEDKGAVKVDKFIDKVNNIVLTKSLELW